MADDVMLLDVQDPQDGFSPHIVVAVVKMTKPLAQLILSRAKIAKELKAQDKSFSRLCYWDFHALYYPYRDEDQLPTEQAEALSSECPVFVAELQFKTQPENTEHDQMIVDDECVWWRTSSKHSQVFSTTSAVMLSEIEKFL